MKKIIGTIALLMTLQASALTDVQETITCYPKGTTVFSIQLSLKKVIGHFDIYKEIYSAQFRTAQGPRLVGVFYDVTVFKNSINTRLIAGASYSAQLHDGRQLYIEDITYASTPAPQYPGMTAQITHGDETSYFDCQKN
jgi:hypothetical protein